MTRIAFADESGTSNNTPCYAIGVVSVDEDHLGTFESSFYKLKERHGFKEEAKWTYIRKGHGLINFTLEWLNLLLTSKSVRFDAIVVNKNLYRNWQGSQDRREAAFYQTYTYLLRHIARRANDITEVYIDDRSDSYDKRHEVVETIGNHMLAKLESKGRLSSVKKVKSHNYAGIQVADLITGAITSSHLRFINPETPINHGKYLTIERMAWMLGWDDLCYDTYPHPRFNIWHFPQEYRAIPRSETPNPRGKVPFVTLDDLK